MVNIIAVALIWIRIFHFKPSWNEAISQNDLPIFWLLLFMQ